MKWTKDGDNIWRTATGTAFGEVEVERGLTGPGEYRVYLGGRGVFDFEATSAKEALRVARTWMVQEVIDLAAVLAGDAR